MCRTGASLDVLLRALATDFDIVYDLDEHFDLALLELATRLGLTADETAAAMRYERVSPRPRLYGGGATGDVKANAWARACPNMTTCREHVHRIAPLDIELHQQAKALFRPSAATSSFAASVASYRSVASSVASMPAPPISLARPASARLTSGYSPRCAPSWLLERPAHHQRKGSPGGQHAALHTKGAPHSRLHQHTRACRGLRVPALEAAAAVFGGTCSASISVDSMHEAVDDESHAVRPSSLPNLPGLQSIALAAESGGGGRRGGAAEVNKAVAVAGECQLLGDLSAYRDSADADCDEVRAVFYFAPPPPPGMPPKFATLPRIVPSACNVALVDNTTDFGPKASGAERKARGGGSAWASGWKLRRLAEWPFPRDGARTAHYLKVVAPLLFPEARVVLAGDIKCAGSGGGLPCALMRDGLAPSVQLRVAKNRWFRSRSVEGEFVSTWRHMRGRKMGAHTFREITAQLSRYESEGYDMDAIHTLPDTFCMAWLVQTPEARAFACRLGREVATRSMREQLSFDHARPAGINISWWAMKVIGQHGNAECVANASSTEREPTTASAATTTTVVSGGRGRRLREIIPASEAEAAMLALSGLWPTYQPMVVPDVASPAIARSTAVASPAIAPSAAVASTVAAASPVPMSLHHAVCVTGLTRSFAEIGAGVRSRVFGLLAGSASHVRIETFGVRPANDTWSSVRAHLGPFSGLEKQVPCRPAGEPLPAFFTCQRGRTTHRMDTCTSSFVQMQCDLAHCDAMIARHEAGGVGSDAAGTGARIGASTAARQFDYVTWMRLDVAWEVDLMPALPLPALATDRAGIIWLPQMNSQQAGLCDKFAFGTRAAMHKYLNRVDLISLNFSAVPRNRQGLAAAWSCADRDKKQVCNPKPFADTAALCTKRAGCMVSMSSERFLSFALYKANLTVVRMKWAFCKYGNTTYSWHGCTARLHAGTQQCKSLNCPAWMAGGCTCLNTTCAKTSWYCIPGPGSNSLAA